MEDAYRLADIKNDNEVISKISNFEEELSRTMGQDVVLIAYTNKNDR